MESHLQSDSGPRECLVLKANTTHSSSLAAEIPAYAQLQREMHDALLAQHPEWIGFYQLAIALPATFMTRDSRSCSLLHWRPSACEKDKASNVVRGPWPSPARDPNDPGNVSIPAKYAEPRKIVFRKMASAVR